MAKNKRGRPAGSKNRKKVAVAEMKRTSCPKCGSKERTAYCQRRKMDASGKDIEGRIFTAVTWRRCQCEGCGQWRDDRELVYL